MNLKNFFETAYAKNPQVAVSLLTDDEFLKANGLKTVFHEGLGNGICSVEEGIVVVYDEDDLETYSDYDIYEYNPDAWVTMQELSEGKTGEEYEVAPIESYNKVAKIWL